MKKILAALLAVVLLTAVCMPALAEYKIHTTGEWEAEKGKYSTLKKGSKGRAVEKLQRRLVELGYLCEGDVDGVYGNVTYNAVYIFQLKNWLTGADGVAYPYTQYKLYNKFAVPNEGIQMNFPVDENSPTIDIERMERRLRDTGYMLSDEAVDGVFDLETFCAVMTFEIVNGFEHPDFIADAEMLYLLFSYDMHSCEEEILDQVYVSVINALSSY